MPEDAVRDHQTIGEDRGFIEPAVAIRIFQHPDKIGPALRELLFVKVEAGALGDEESSAFIEASHHRVADQGWRRRELHGKAGWDGHRWPLISGGRRFR